MKSLVSTLLQRSTLMVTSFILAISSLSAAMPLFLSQTASAVGTTVVNVSGDTSAGENQPGWMFNRDVSTSTPFVFNSDAASTGIGSLYIKPIGVNPSDKMIAENFLGANISDINSISYDFKVGTGGNATSYKQFYMNVYANFGESSPTKFYDCRYNVVPSSGSTTNFTTATFDPTQSYTVATSGSSPHACPSSPSGMDALSTGNSVMRVFALNVGDTTTVDSGLSGYLDNVVVDLSSGTTISNFEPVPIPACVADNKTFDTFTTGSVNGQNGWKSTGSYDQAVVDNTYGINTFGCKTLRISNAVTTGGFGDQTFSYAAPESAGESSTGAVNNHFEGSFDIASAMSALQPGMVLSVSPDDGTGNRMSYLSFADTAGGIDVTFYDVQGSSNPSNFVSMDLGTYPRAPQNVKFVIDYNNGPSNDVVKIYIDGLLVHTGTTWENYYRYDTEQSGNGNIVPSTDRVLFRAAGPAAPSNAGNGFLFDNVDVSTATVLPASPVNPRWLNHVGDTLGAYTNVNQVTPAWTTPATGTVDHYEYSYTSPTNSNWSAPSSFTSTSIPDQAFGGAGNNGVQGQWQFRVRTVDQFNNMSPWVPSPAITYDKTAPIGTATYTGGNRVGNIIYLKTINDLQYDLSLTDNIQLEHTSYAVWKADSNFNNRTLFCGNWNNAITSENVSGTSANPSGYVKDCSPLGNWSDGSYVIMHVAYDAAGNLTYFGDTYPGQKFVIDSHKPSVTATMSDTTINSTDPNPTVTVTATDTTSGIDYMQYVIMDASANNVTSWFTLSSPTEVVDLSGLPLDGAYTLRARAFDNAGNKKSGADVAFTIDRTLPVAAITTTGTQSTATPTISGTVDADADTLVFTIDGIVQPITWTSGDTTWTSTPATALSDGIHNMSIVATDSAGNEGGQNGTITISVPAPLITPLATTPGGGTGTPTPTPQATVTPGEVLGDQTTNDATKTDDTKANPSASILGDATSNPMNLFGLAWYWWLAILAAIIAAWWIIAAALRRRDNQNV